MNAGLVRLGVTTTPEQAASASASSRMIGPAFSLICMAWGVQKVRRSSRKILAWANGAARGPSTLVLAKWLGRRSCWATVVPANLLRGQEGRHAQGWPISNRNAERAAIGRVAKTLSAPDSPTNRGYTRHRPENSTPAKINIAI
jgi:hypothetical protein